MITKAFSAVAVALGVLVVGHPAALAKTIAMGPLGPGVVKTACARNGGNWYDTGSGYGCVAQGVIISCSSQACQADVSDMEVVTGNSLDYILGLGEPNRAATMIRPVDARISSRSEAQTSAAQPIGR